EGNSFRVGEAFARLLFRCLDDENIASGECLDEGESESLGVLPGAGEELRFRQGVIVVDGTSIIGTNKFNIGDLA
ncbi:MAG TPA: hypothetical protein PKH51_06740, partial [Candidatus Sumerlaeota bacterium]|nr:hypothetical protein [Candidatus Sumerlaeota bacterium]